MIMSENRALEKLPAAVSDDDGSARTTRPPTIVVIDDDVQLQHAVARVLHASHNCVVHGFNSVESFLGEVDKGRIEHVDLILLDFHLPGQNGPRLVEELRRRSSALLDNSYIMGMTGDPERLVQSEFHDAGIEEIIQKPLRKTDFTKITKVAVAVNEHIAGLAYGKQASRKDPSGRANSIKKYI